MRRLGIALAVGMMTTILGMALFFSPFGQWLEENVGLDQLFHLRGVQAPPAGVVIINLDAESCQHLGLPQNFSRWPRTVHAKLIEKLQGFGARVIVFDVFFAEPRNLAEDSALAEAIQRAGNVVLYADLSRQVVGSPEAQANVGQVEIDVLTPPAPLLAEAALELAPFPLPKIPVSVRQAWLFKTSAGEVPTLPAVAMLAMTLPQTEALQRIVVTLLPGEKEALAAIQAAAAAKDLVGMTRILRQMLQRHPEWPTQWQARQQELLQPLADAERQALCALIAMVQGDSSMTIRFYGPPGTLPTLSCHTVLTDDESLGEHLRQQLQDKVVFIGAAQKSWSGQRDGFHTVFSRNGLDLSGVEIAATVFANLLEQKRVGSLSPLAASVLCCGVGVCAALLGFLFEQTAWAVSTLAVGSLLYGLAAWGLFVRWSLWLPFAMPLLVQVPLTLASVLGYRFVKTHRERTNLRTALGYYLPPGAVEPLVRDLKSINTGNQMVFAACLLTDAQRYTALSESLHPEALSTLLKDYFRHLYGPVKEQGGIVCNIIGDSMLALWPSVQPDPATRAKACQAALQVLHSVEEFNQLHPATPLPTRIGLHYGAVLMGNIGAEEHYEYAPLGDIVNTTSRIEGLNKQLGTHVLVSAEALVGQPGLLTRHVGLFLFEGKTKPIIIHEILPARYGQDASWPALLAHFDRALNAFQVQNWESAIQEFRECLVLVPQDGPSLYYLEYCSRLQRESVPAYWNGMIKVRK